MEAVERIQFESNGFGKRLKSMCKVDFRRMFTMPLYYILLGVCLVMPILILVMTTMVGDTTMVDPNTGVETAMDTFTNTWQAIGSISGESSAMGMSLTGMCNINMLYFIIAVFLCLFVAGDFRSGYAKNLFAVRAKKSDYVISKTLVGFVGGVGMLLAFFVGAVIGGAVAGLSFDLGTAGVSGLIMCLLSKLFLVGVFVPIYLLMSVAGKQKAWLSLILSLCVGMLFFTMIPMLTPLDATILNAVLCLAGAALFSAGLGAVSNIVLKKTSLV